MYPTRELSRLQLRKAALRAQIAVTRWECTGLAAEAARPVEWLDRAIMQWRKISPVAKMAAVPLALVLRRRLLPRRFRLLSTAVKLLPVALGAARMWTSRAR